MENKKLFRIHVHPLSVFYTLLALLLLFLVIGSWDQRVSITMDGILWNQETGEFLDTATLTITGKINRKAFKNDQFRGELLLDRHQSDEYDIYLDNLIGDVTSHNQAKHMGLADHHYSISRSIGIWYLKDQSALRLYDQYLPQNVYFIGPAENTVEAERATAALFETI